MQDILVLGDYVFDEWSTPQKLPVGGDHKHAITEIPGGERVVDLWGPNDPPREWTGMLRGASAEEDAQTLDQMRIEGRELQYSNGAEARTVVIISFQYWICRGYVEYSIKILTVDRSGGGSGGGGLGSIDSMISADLGAALKLVGF